MSLGFQVVAATAAEWPLLRAGRDMVFAKAVSAVPPLPAGPASPCGREPWRGVGGRFAQQLGGKLSLFFASTWSFPLASTSGLAVGEWQAVVGALFEWPASGCFLGQHSGRESGVRPSSPGAGEKPSSLLHSEGPHSLLGLPVSASRPSRVGRLLERPLVLPPSAPSPLSSFLCQPHLPDSLQAIAFPFPFAAIPVTITPSPLPSPVCA